MKTDGADEDLVVFTHNSPAVVRLDFRLQVETDDLLRPGPIGQGRLMRIAEDLKIKGPRIFDLAIALTAYEAGAGELWTHDSRFQSVPGLRVVLPLQVK